MSIDFNTTIVSLIRSALKQDNDEVKHNVDLVIKYCETTKGKSRLGDRVKAVLRNSGNFHTTPTYCKFINKLSPHHNLDDVILTNTTSDVINGLIKESEFSDELAKHNITHANKLLFAGASGVGKTMLAQSIGKELGRDVCVINSGSIFESYLGNTMKNLSDIFKFINSNVNTIYVIDEFDNISKSRVSKKHDHSEVDRIVNTFIQYLDNMSVGIGNMIIATTNNPDIIDSAILRRFNFILDFEPYIPEEVVSMFHNKLVEKYNTVELGDIVIELHKQISYAEYENMFVNAVKSIVMTK